MRWVIILAAFMVAVAPRVTAQEAQPAAAAAQPEFKILHTEIDSVGWAFDALLKYPAERRQYIRFVYVPPWGDKEWIGVMDYAVNTACSQSRTLHRGDVHAGGFMIAYDLAKYATGAELIRLMAVWDGLAIRDPYFHVPEVNVQEVECEACNGGGKLTYTRTDQFRRTVREVGPCNKCNGTGKIKGGNTKVALLAPHLGAALAKHATNPDKDERVDVLVTNLTTSTGAIYRADWLLEQLLTSARGRYPEFRQINFESKEHTPLAAHLKRRGFFPEQSVEIGGEKGALLLISEVTGKSRVVLATYGLGSRTPLVTTYDYKDNRTRPDEQFIRNLVEYDAFSDASEVFVPLGNGLLEYLLTDADGKFQRVAPPDVVADSTKPDGHTKELEMGMSCIMCHSPNDGYNTAKNDMELLLGADVDFFGEDFSYTNRAGDKVTLKRNAIVDLVAGRYGERIDEPDGVLGRARRDYSRAVAKLTDYQTKADGPSVVARLGLKIKEIYHGYRYRRIDAAKVCLELGVAVGPQEPKGVLRTLVPVPVAGQQEDVLISLLRNGAVIKRDDMEAIYGEMARRAVATRPTMKSGD